MQAAHSGENSGTFIDQLVNGQGTLLNASRLASGLAVNSPTITGYINLLVDLLLDDSPQ